MQALNSKIRLTVVVLHVGMFVLSAGPPAFSQCQVQRLDRSMDRFGFSVSIGPNVAVVGATGYNCPGYNCGSAYVFRFNGSSWDQDAWLTASDQDTEDNFGESVSTSADVVLIGAYKDNCAAGNDCGSAYVYRFNGDSWVEEAKLTASDADEVDGFGKSVSLDGDVAVVGAYRDDCAAGPSCGSAYVFRFDPKTSEWIQEQKLTASDAAEGDYFGESVSLDGDVVVVGASNVDCAGGSDCGAAYVFRFDGGGWVEEAVLTASDRDRRDDFGRAVSVHGDVAVVGAYRNDGPGDDSGAAYVYRFDGAAWVEEDKLTASDAAEGDRLGLTVSITGDVVLVGAYRDDCPAGEDCGAAYVYRFNGAEWVEEGKLTASPMTEDDRFGYSTSMSDNVAIVGAIGRLPEMGDGSVYIYQLLGDPDCNANTINDACEYDCNGNGAPDECDTADGTSEDCNDNTIPDECETYADCNGNGVQDICDVFDGTSEDCNYNLVPDECEPDEDCNGNGMTDICDIGAGTAEDCNDNWVPDECDIADGTSEDDDGNGVPDECEPVVVRIAGPTNALPGETVTLDVFVSADPAITLYGYQLAMPCSSSGGISGSVDFVPPLVIDTTRPDFWAAGLPVFGFTDPGDCPTGVNPSFFAMLFPGSDPPTIEETPKYLGEGTYHVSDDAFGVFTLDLPPDPASALLGPYDPPIPFTAVGITLAVGECVDAWHCDDGDACTMDACEPGDPKADPFGCVHEYQQRRFADLVPDFCPPVCPQPDLLDIVCVLDDFGDGPLVDGCKGNGYSDTTDLAPCGGDGILDLGDLLAVLDAFGGVFNCPGPCP